MLEIKLIVSLNAQFSVVHFYVYWCAFSILLLLFLKEWFERFIHHFPLSANSKSLLVGDICLYLFNYRSNNIWQFFSQEGVQKCEDVQVVNSEWRCFCLCLWGKWDVSACLSVKVIARHWFPPFGATSVFFFSWFSL